MCIGNLDTEAGFSVIESRPYIHKWPPKPGSSPSSFFSRPSAEESRCSRFRNSKNALISGMTVSASAGSTMEL